MSIYKPKGCNIVQGAGSLIDTILATEPASLLGYYPCDDSSGALTDLSDNGNDLAVVGSGASYSIAGQVGDAVNGNGSQGWTNYPTPDTGVSFLPGDGGYTVMLLIRPTSSASAIKGIAAVSADTSFGVPNIELNSATDVFAKAINTDGDGVSSDSINNSLSYLRGAGQWDHLVMRASTNGDLDLFLNGVRTNIDNTTWLTTPVDNPLNILAVNCRIAFGFIAGFNSAVNIQHVAFWDTALTNGHIQRIFNATGI